MLLLVLARVARLVLINFTKGALSQLNGLEEVLHLLVLFGIDGVAELLEEKVIILLLSLLFLLLLEGLEVFLAFFDVGRLAHEIERRRHLLRDLGSLLDFAHRLSHLVFIWVGDAYDLVDGRNLPLRDLMTVFDVVLERQVV
jgi:hypothetical protein